MKLALEEGKILVEIARKSVESFLKKEKFKIKNIPTSLRKKFGVFVTLETFPSEELRGCIGFVEGEEELYKLVQKAALQAAFNDPRFPPLSLKELDRIVFEVSVLGELKEIKGSWKEKLEKIKPEKDGVLLKRKNNSVLFLPQVWKVLPDKIEFLENLCLKGLMEKDCWKDKQTKIFVFSVQAFKEIEPKGKIKLVIYE